MRISSIDIWLMCGRAPVSRVPIKQEVSAQRLWAWKIGKLGKQQQRQVASEIVIHRDMACVVSKIKHPVDPQQRKSWLVKNVLIKTHFQKQPHIKQQPPLHFQRDTLKQDQLSTGFAMLENEEKPIKIPSGLCACNANANFAVIS
ncbi:hypothetical protein NC651_034602 [Populus alba x Populus x berolinensis]|nr:hypothetical protein NC651_034602 [Populus alba x Populus x berolinensis]